MLERLVTSQRWNWIWPRFAIDDSQPRASLQQRLRQMGAEEAAATDQHHQFVFERSVVRHDHLSPDIGRAMPQRARLAKRARELQGVA